MTASWRLAGGVLVLTLYACVLKPPAGTVSPRDTLSGGVESWLALSDAALKAGRYADARTDLAAGSTLPRSARLRRTSRAPSSVVPCFARRLHRCRRV